MCQSCAGAAKGSVTEPLPLAARTARVYPAGADLRRVASDIAERAWATKGVRVYRWPNGMLALVVPGSGADQALLKYCDRFLLATWARGTTCDRVLDELRSAGRRA